MTGMYPRTARRRPVLEWFVRNGGGPVYRAWLWITWPPYRRIVRDRSQHLPPNSGGVS